MKGFILALAIGSTLTFVSCDENARLAKNLSGSWTGTPENFTNNTDVTTTIIETYDMVNDPAAIQPAKNGGVVTIAGMLSASTQILGEPGMIEPLTLTVSGNSKISGKWTVIDDDEVALVLDPSTLTVNVDSAAVVVNGIVTEANAPKLDSIKPSVAQSIATSLRSSLAMRYSSIRQLDDVKVKEPLLKFEIGKTDYVFTRQGSVQ